MSLAVTIGMQWELFADNDLPLKTIENAAKKARNKVYFASHKEKTRSRKKTNAIYIYAVLKQVHPDVSILSKPISIMNSDVNDIRRLAIK